MTKQKDMIETKSRQQKWRFFRSGGFDQVRIETADDFRNLDQLDQKLWAALSCPVKGLEFDPRTLELLDTDDDKKIRVLEVISAVKWTCSVLKNPEDLFTGSPALPLDAINDNTAEGRQLLSSSREILKNLGKTDALAITPEDTTDTTRIFAKTRFNGDGIIPLAATDDAGLRRAIEDIMAVMGTEKDLSGEQGISYEKVKKFFEEAQAFSDWWSDAEAKAEKVLPFGDMTIQALNAYQAIKAKIDDYFIRCHLVAFDSRAAEPLNPSKARYRTLAHTSLSVKAAELATLPLARIEAERPLPLTEHLNPAWIELMKEFRTNIIQPLFGTKASLTAGEWEMIRSKFTAYEEWQVVKKGTLVEKLGLKRIRELLTHGAKEAIFELIAKDKSLEPEIKAITAVERLAHYYRDLITLINNFVSFRDFYTGKKKAIFQAGTLYLDQRNCDLCIRVDDVGKHSTLAQLGRIHLVYCECTRKSNTEKLNIVAALTSGDSDNLMVGRNAIFYDRQGRDWDATIVKIVEHPISIKQAFWSPYKRIIRMISDQIEKIAAARDKSTIDKASGGVVGITQTTDTGKTMTSQSFDVAKFAGIFAAIGLAIGAIGTAIASVITGFLRLAWWQMPLSIVGLVFIVSGPSMVIAWLKLRERNLAPILDASGWAVNTRARMNIPFGTALTGIAALPHGAERALYDPFAERKRPWKLYSTLFTIALLILFLWYQGFIKQWATQIYSYVMSWETTHTSELEAPAKKPADTQVQGNKPDKP